MRWEGGREGGGKDGGRDRQMDKGLDRRREAGRESFLFPPTFLHSDTLSTSRPAATYPASCLDNPPDCTVCSTPVSVDGVHNHNSSISGND